MTEYHAQHSSSPTSPLHPDYKPKTGERVEVRTLEEVCTLQLRGWDLLGRPHYSGNYEMAYPVCMDAPKEREDAQTLRMKTNLRKWAVERVHSHYKNLSRKQVLEEAEALVCYVLDGRIPTS